MGGPGRNLNKFHVVGPLPKDTSKLEKTKLAKRNPEVLPPRAEPAQARSANSGIHCGRTTLNWSKPSKQAENKYKTSAGMRRREGEKGKGERKERRRERERGEGEREKERRWREAGR